MKKFICLMLALVMTVSMVSCGDIGGLVGNLGSITTEATTEAPTTEEATTEEVTTEEIKQGDGCESSISLMGMAIVITLGTCTAFVAKKKED